MSRAAATAPRRPVRAGWGAIQVRAGTRSGAGGKRDSRWAATVAVVDLVGPGDLPLIAEGAEVLDESDRRPVLFALSMASITDSAGCEGRGRGIGRVTGDGSDAPIAHGRGRTVPTKAVSSAHARIKEAVAAARGARRRPKAKGFGCKATSLRPAAGRW